MAVRARHFGGMRSLVPILFVALACAAPALAQTPPPREAANEVSPVTVMPKTEPPRVVATYPATGQAIAPGVLVIKVTFDQPMSPTGFNFAASPASETPECLPTPRLLDDRKSFVLLCRVTAGKTYGLSLNGAAAGGFVNLAENRAVASAMSFSVTPGDPVTTLRRAMTAAGLREVDAPIIEAPRP